MLSMLLPTCLLAWRYFGLRPRPAPRRGVAQEGLPISQRHAASPLPTREPKGGMKRVAALGVEGSRLVVGQLDAEMFGGRPGPACMSVRGWVPAETEVMLLAFSPER
jgi:hypothetical protein